MEATETTGTHENQDKDEEDERATTGTGRGCDRRGADETWAARGSDMGGARGGRLLRNRCDVSFNCAFD